MAVLKKAESSTTSTLIKTVSSATGSGRLLAFCPLQSVAVFPCAGIPCGYRKGDGENTMGLFSEQTSKGNTLLCFLPLTTRTLFRAHQFFPCPGKCDQRGQAGSVYSSPSPLHYRPYFDNSACPAKRLFRGLPDRIYLLNVRSQKESFPQRRTVGDSTVSVCKDFFSFQEGRVSRHHAG